MKSFITAAFACLFLSTSFAQHKGHAPSKAGSAKTKATFSQALNHYFAVKDALVATNGIEAHKHAVKLVAAFKNMNMASMPSKQHAVFMKLQKDILFDAEHVAETKDAGHQRDHFGDLSKNMIAVRKAANNPKQPAYVQYCPMKKVSWLSTAKSIKNPYYGSEMLTCGEVTETIK